MPALGSRGASLFGTAALNSRATADFRHCASPRAHGVSVKRIDQNTRSSIANLRYRFLKRPVLSARKPGSNPVLYADPDVVEFGCKAGDVC